MKILLSKLLKMVFTPKLKRQMFLSLGDHLVKSTKNKLDDKVCGMCKDNLM